MGDMIYYSNGIVRLTSPQSQKQTKKRNASERNIKRYYQGQSHSIQTVHKQGTTAVGTFEVQLVLQIDDWQTCLGGTVVFDIRKITGLRTAGTGAAS